MRRNRPPSASCCWATCRRDARPCWTTDTLRLILALLLACIAPALQAQPKLTADPPVVWTRDAPWFGGFSGVEVSADGGEMTVISDRGWLAMAEMIRDEQGHLTGLRLRSDTPLRNKAGTPLTGRFNDAEGLAIATNGRAWASFEHAHRVARLDLATGHTEDLPPHPDFARLQPNSGLEALATHPDGRLFALPERSGANDRPFPLYMRGDRGWQVAGRIPRRGPFLPVGADFDAEGRLYLLERTVTLLGFRSRIRRFEFREGGMIEQTLLTTFPAKYDNLESISAWQGPDGRTRLTLISDDNFLSIQRTQVVEFAVTE
jgi:hypothetical protein